MGTVQTKCNLYDTYCISIRNEHICFCQVASWHILPLSWWGACDISLCSQKISSDVKEVSNCSRAHSTNRKGNSTSLPFPPISLVCLFLPVELYGISVLALIMASLPASIREENGLNSFHVTPLSSIKLHERCFWPSVYCCCRTFYIVAWIFIFCLQLRGSLMSQVPFKTLPILRIKLCWQSYF